LNTPQLTNQPVKRVSNWYKGQIEKVKARELETSREQYDAEIKKFNDTFDSVAQLDGTSYDSNNKPGEVQTNYSPLTGARSLRKTDEGFALSVSTGMGLGAAAFLPAVYPSPFGGMVPRKTHERTEYNMNEKTGTISVTRDTTTANFHGQSSVTKESFILDTEQGLLVDKKSKVEDTSSDKGRTKSPPINDASTLLALMREHRK